MILSRSAGDPLLSNSSTLALLSNQAVLDVQTTSKSPCTRNPSRPVAAAPRTLPRIPLPMWLTDHAAAVFDKPLPEVFRGLFVAFLLRNQVEPQRKVNDEMPRYP